MKLKQGASLSFYHEVVPLLTGRGLSIQALLGDPDVYGVA